MTESDCSIPSFRSSDTLGPSGAASSLAISLGHFSSAWRLSRPRISMWITVASSPSLFPNETHHTGSQTTLQAPVAAHHPSCSTHAHRWPDCLEVVGRSLARPTFHNPAVHNLHVHRVNGVALRVSFLFAMTFYRYVNESPSCETPGSRGADHSLIGYLLAHSPTLTRRGRAMLREYLARRTWHHSALQDPSGYHSLHVPLVHELFLGRRLYHCCLPQRFRWYRILSLAAWWPSWETLKLTRLSRYGDNDVYSLREGPECEERSVQHAMSVTCSKSLIDFHI